MTKEGGDAARSKREKEAAFCSHPRPKGRGEEGGNLNFCLGGEKRGRGVLLPFSTRETKSRGKGGGRKKYLAFHVG